MESDRVVEEAEREGVASSQLGKHHLAPSPLHTHTFRKWVGLQELQKGKAGGRSSPKLHLV